MAAQQLASSLARDCYVSDAVYRAELEQIFMGHWLCVGRSEDIGGPGATFLWELAGESVIILRDGAGQARAFFNVCRHRGTRLCTEQSGQLRKTIQCPYHAWTYGLDGRLLGAPHMDEVAGFDKAAWPLHAAALVEWEGFLFLNLSPRPAPFAEAFGAVQGKFARWRLPELERARRIQYDVAANWKLLFQNYSECYHCPGVHPALSRLSPYRSGRNDLREGLILGGPSLLEQTGGSLTLSGRRCALPLAGVSGAALQEVYFYTIFPNMFLSLHPDYVMVHTVTPLGPGRSRVLCDFLFHPESAGRPDFDPDDAAGFWDLTNREDWAMCERTQQGVQSRAYTPGPYSTLETMAAAFERTYLQAMERA